MKRIVMIIMAAALVALPTMAEIEGWRSTSVLQGASSTYQAPITEVGAVGVRDMATTTDSYSPSGGPRKIEAIGGGDGEGGSGLGNPGEGDPSSPIGDAVLPLMLMAVAFCGVIYYRRRKAAKS